LCGRRAWTVLGRAKAQRTPAIREHRDRPPLRCAPAGDCPLSGPRGSLSPRASSTAASGTRPRIACTPSSVPAHSARRCRRAGVSLSCSLYRPAAFQLPQVGGPGGKALSGPPCHQSFLNSTSLTFIPASRSSSSQTLSEVAGEGETSLLQEAWGKGSTTAGRIQRVSRPGAVLVTVFRSHVVEGQDIALPLDVAVELPHGAKHALNEDIPVGWGYDQVPAFGAYDLDSVGPRYGQMQGPFRVGPPALNNTDLGYGTEGNVYAEGPAEDYPEAVREHLISLRCGSEEEETRQYVVMMYNTVATQVFARANSSDSTTATATTRPSTGRRHQLDRGMCFESGDWGRFRVLPCTAMMILSPKWSDKLHREKASVVGARARHYNEACTSCCIRGRSAREAKVPGQHCCKRTPLPKHSIIPQDQQSLSPSMVTVGHPSG